MTASKSSEGMLGRFAQHPASSPMRLRAVTTIHRLSKRRLQMSPARTSATFWPRSIPPRASRQTGPESPARTASKTLTIAWPLPLLGTSLRSSACQKWAFKRLEVHLTVYTDKQIKQSMTRRITIGMRSRRSLKPKW